MLFTQHRDRLTWMGKHHVPLLIFRKGHSLCSISYIVQPSTNRIETHNLTKQSSWFSPFREISDSSIRVFLIQDNPANSVKGMTMVLLKEKPASSRVCGGFFLMRIAESGILGDSATS